MTYNEQHWTPLYYAVKNEDDLLIQYLMAHCKDKKGLINDRNSSNKKTVLHIAVEQDGLLCMLELLRWGADLDLKDLYKRKPLDYIVPNGNIEKYMELKENKVFAGLRSFCV